MNILNLLTKGLIKLKSAISRITSGFLEKQVEEPVPEQQGGSSENLFYIRREGKFIAFRYKKFTIKGLMFGEKVIDYNLVNELVGNRISDYEEKGEILANREKVFGIIDNFLVERSKLTELNGFINATRDLRFTENNKIIGEREKAFEEISNILGLRQKPIIEQDYFSAKRTKEDNLLIIAKGR